MNSKEDFMTAIFTDINVFNQFAHHMINFLYFIDTQTHALQPEFLSAVVKAADDFADLEIFRARPLL